MKKIRVGFLIVLFIGAFFYNLIQGSYLGLPQEEAILSAFHHSNSNAVQTNINARGKILQTEIDQSTAVEIGEKFLSGLHTENKYEIKEVNKKNSKGYELTKTSKDAIVKVIVESFRGQEHAAETYAVIDVTLYNHQDKISMIKQQIEEVFQSYQIKPTTNILMIGTYDGNLKKTDMKNIISNIFNNMHAVKAEQYEDTYQFGYTGYTKLIHQYITSGRHRINMDARLRYNKYEDKTYLYLATPIIEIET